MFFDSLPANAPPESEAIDERLAFARESLDHRPWLRHRRIAVVLGHVIDPSGCVAVLVTATHATRVEYFHHMAESELSQGNMRASRGLYFMQHTHIHILDQYQ